MQPVVHQELFKVILAMRRWDEAAKAISPHCYDDYHYFYCCYMLLLHPLVLDTMQTLGGL